MDLRTVTGADGTEWEAYAADAIVAHGRAGAALAFRRAGAVDGGIQSTVTFNSMAAADLALRTMSAKEIRRYLSLARQAEGRPQVRD